MKVNSILDVFGAIILLAAIAVVVRRCRGPSSVRVMGLPTHRTRRVSPQRMTLWRRLPPPLRRLVMPLVALPVAAVALSVAVALPVAAALLVPNPL